MAGLCWERLGLAGCQGGLVGLLRLGTSSAWILPLWRGLGKVLRSREPGMSPEKPINSKSHFFVSLYPPEYQEHGRRMSFWLC